MVVCGELGSKWRGKKKETASKRLKRIKALPKPGKALIKSEEATLRRRLDQLDNSQRIKALFKPEMVTLMEMVPPRDQVPYWGAKPHVMVLHCTCIHATKISISAGRCLFKW